MPDRALISRARCGDRDAVAELYRDHVGAALRYARAITPNNADAEDLVAESFTRVISQLSLAKGPDAAFRAYLFTTMRHRLYHSNQREIPVDDEAVLDRAVCDRSSDERADHGLLRRAFHTLSAQDQEVLLLLDVHELRPGEASARLDIRPSTLSMRAARARNALAEAYLVAHLQPVSESKCEPIRPLLGRHVRGTLPPLRAATVREHLDECVDCTTAVDELRGLNRGLRAVGTFALPAAAPRGWRTVHRVRRPGRPLPKHLHALTPAAIKSAAVAAALAAGASTALVLAGHTSTPLPPSARAPSVSQAAARVAASAPSTASATHAVARTSAAPTVPVDHPDPAAVVPVRSTDPAPHTANRSSAAASPARPGRSSPPVSSTPAPPTTTPTGGHCRGWHGWHHDCQPR